MDNDNERLRQYRHISNQLEGAKRPHRDAYAMANRIIKLAEEDVDGWCPNNYEEIMARMDVADGVMEFLVGYLRDLLNKMLKVNFYSEGLEGTLYGIESLRDRLINLRLSMIIWAKRFEGERPPATPEELEAEDERTRQLYLYPVRNPAATKTGSGRHGGSGIIGCGCRGRPSPIKVRLVKRKMRSVSRSHCFFAQDA